MNTIDQIINECRKLRIAFERDEARFFIGLAEIADKHTQTITDANCATFEAFLKKHEICEPSRYSTFRKGLAYTTPERAAELGTHAVMELAQVREPANVPKYEEAVSAWRETHGGVAPTRETACRLLRQVDPRAEVPAATKQVSELNRLRAENAELRAEIRALRAENAELKSKLEKASKKKAA